MFVKICVLFEINIHQRNPIHSFPKYSCHSPIDLFIIIVDLLFMYVLCTVLSNYMTFNMIYLINFEDILEGLQHLHYFLVKVDFYYCELLNNICFTFHNKVYLFQYNYLAVCDYILGCEVVFDGNT